MTADHDARRQAADSQGAVAAIAGELAYAVGFEDRRELCRLDAERILSALAEAGYTVVKTEALREGAEALGAAFKVALTVKPLLDKPYPDDPRWTPWTRWVDRAARRCFNARSTLRKAARGPWVPVPEGSADRGSEEGGER